MTFKKFVQISLLATLGLTGQAHAQTALDLNLSNDALRFALAQENNYAGESQVMGLDVIHTDKKGNLMSGFASVARLGFEAAPNLDVGLKGKGYYLQPNSGSNDGYGMMLGGFARYWVQTEAPVALSAEYLLGPSILSAGKIDSANEFNLRAEVQILPTAVAYIGYRKIEMDLSGATYTFDDGAHLGIKLAFDL
ncbi:MAG: hypothetical protein JXK16_11775 [Thiotrichales bacterium]|nr:hypothetical protein [Thiotrichales bacterium]